MNQMLLAFCLVLGGASYWLYTENETLKANNAKLEGAIATQEEAIATMQKDFTLQTEQLQSMTMKSQYLQMRVLFHYLFSFPFLLDLPVFLLLIYIL